MSPAMLPLVLVACLRHSAALPPSATDACGPAGACGASDADEAALLQARRGAAGAAPPFSRRRATTPAPPADLRVWAATEGDVTAYPWPEQAAAVGLVARTKSVGVAVSGGGSRSYAAGYGQLRALYELGLLSKARYLSGTSGGGWVTGVYTYHQTGVDDETLLGSTPAPSELSLEGLADLPHTSLGWGATGDMLFHLAAELVAYIARGRTHPGKIWAEAAGGAFLSNYGLGSDQYFTLDSAALGDILGRNGRNPRLRSGSFLLPARPDRPYLLMSAATVGPLPEACTRIPFEEADPQKCASYRSKLFRPVSVTPLYTGFAADRGQSLFVTLGDGSKNQVHEGGLVESWAFGGPAPIDGLGAAPPGVNGQLREAPPPEQPWSLKAALGATSAFGTYDVYWYENGTRSGPQRSVATGDGAIDMITQPVETAFGFSYDGAQLLGQQYKIWDSSDAAPQAESVYLSDGGTSGDYAAIQDLVARGVDHVVSFYNTATPLCGADAWDPAANATAARVWQCMHANLAALFGVEAESPSYGHSDISAAHQQIFPRASFVPFAKALQASMAANKTAFARVQLTTVANGWRKVPAGRRVDLALFYLSSSKEFEASLPQETREELESGSAFANFPHYRTLGNNDLLSFDWALLSRKPPANPIRAGLTSITPQQTNLLAALTGWAVLEHAAEVGAMFS